MPGVKANTQKKGGEEKKVRASLSTRAAKLLLSERAL
jgi:hypothetical protein